MFFGNFLSLYALKWLFFFFLARLLVVSMFFFASRHLDNDARLLLLDNGYWLRLWLLWLLCLDRFWSWWRCNGRIARKVGGRAVCEDDIDATHCWQKCMGKRLPRRRYSHQVVLLLYLALVAAQYLQNLLFVGDGGLLYGGRTITPFVGGRSGCYVCCRMLFLDVCSHRFSACASKCDIFLCLSVGRGVTVYGNGGYVHCCIG